MTYRVAVAVSGRGSNLQALCTALTGDAPARVVLAVSERHAPALDFAASCGIATHVLVDHHDAAEWTAVLAAHEVDLLVLAGYLKLLPAAVVGAHDQRIINIHPALLPRHGGSGMYGRRVHEAVLAAADAESGATVHVVDEQYDRGEILGQGRVTVEPGDTPEVLAARVLAMEHRLLPAAVIAAARAGRPVKFELE